MDIALKESLRNYFVQLAKIEEKWKEFNNIVARPLEALKNQSEQFRHVISKEVDDAEICKMDGVRDNLIYKINIGMEDEVSTILNEMRRIKNLVEDLRIKLERLEIVLSDSPVEEPSFKELVDGTSHRPRMDLMLEWAIETSRYYSELCDNIFENFKALDYRNANSVTNWMDSFDQDRERRERIESILGLTQFFVNEPIK